MGSRAALVVGLSGIFVVACGGGGGAPSTYQDPASDQNATEPAPPVKGTAAGPDPAPGAEEDQGAKIPAALDATPSCAPIGGRVVLKLGWTSDRRTVACHDAREANVVFAPDKNAKITAMGPMSDGFCAIDVEVPKGAESGKVRAEVGDDVFESTVVFAVPCR